MSYVSFDESSRIVSFFSRHLAALCLTFRRRHSARDEFAAYSGTLMVVDNVLLYVTAGHVLREVEAAVRSKDIEIKEVVLADIFGLHCKSTLPIPLDIRATPSIYIDDDELGLDFGAVLLPSHYARLLIANGMLAITEKNWANQSGTEFDRCAMLGIPTSTVVFDGHNAPSVTPTLVTFDCVQNDELRGDTILPRFAGRIDPPLPLDCIRGISGGPILGFRKQPKLKYWVVALQSAYNPGSGAVYGCPIPVVARCLQYAFRSQLQNAEP